MGSDIKNKRVNIYIDHGAAEQALESLQKTADKLNKKIDEGRAAGKNMTAELKKLGDTKSAIAGVKEQIDKGLRPSLAQTSNLVSKLRNELKRMSEDAPGYADKFQAYQKARSEMDRLNESIRGVEKAQKSWLQEAKIVAFGVLIGNTVQSAVGAIGSYLSGIVTGNAKLSDSLADVEKATGLSSQGVQDLNKELGKLDTRTKASDLREIAIGLGQIGQSADKANVEAIDKIVVALGDEFGGGPREITTTLSVLRNNLQDLKTGNYAEDVLHIGNALNVLGAEGLATAPVVTDIANRIAGTAVTFKLTSGQILGVAATFQELGIETERGSTAITKIFQKIGSEPEKFAKVAGVSIKEFKNLVNTDMLGAFQKVAEGVKKSGSNNIIFSKILKELDADGSGAGEVLSKLGSNAELLAKKVTTATNALKDGSSVTEEFSKKNTTLGAELDKLNKKLAALIQSKTLSDLFSGAVASLSKFIEVLRATPQWLKENQTAIYFIIAGIVLLNASYLKAGVLIARDTALKIINSTVTKLTAVATNIAAAAQLTYGLIVDVVTGKMKLAAAASAFYSVILKSSLGPIGALITIVGALTIAFTYLFDKQKAVSAAQQRANLEMEKSKKVTEDWNEVQKTANSQVAQTIAHLNELASTAEDTSKSDKERKKAIQGIIDINPTYFKGLDLEAVKTGILRTKVDEYSQALVAAAQQKAIFDKRVSLEQQKLDLQQKLNPGDLVSHDGKVLKLNAGSNNRDGVQLETVGVQLLRRQRNNIQREIDVVDTQLKFLDKKTEELKKKTKDIPGLDDSGTSTATNPFGDKKTAEEKAAERKAQKEQSQREKLLQQLRDFQFELSQVGKQADESEIDRITKKYNELSSKAARYGQSFIEIEKEKNRAIDFLQMEQWKKFRENADKGMKEGLELEYKDLIQGAVDLGEQQKEVQIKRYADGLINKKQLEQQIRSADLETLEFQIAIANSYVGRTKTAYNDLVVFKKKKNKETRDDEVKNREQNEALEKRESLSSAQLAVLKTRPDSKARLDAQLNLLKVERDNELKNTDLTNSEKEKINEEYRQKAAQGTVQFYSAQIEQTLSFISTGLDVISKLNDARSAREKAALDKELKQNETRKESIRRLEESKAISSQESRRRIRAIEIEEEKRKEDLEKKQQARAKRIAIAQAIINGAMAITSTLAATPGPTDILSLGAFRAIQIGLAIVTTAAQIKTITDTKYAKGGVVRGSKHSEGGINMIDSRTGNKVGEMEHNEPYMILSDATYRNNKDVVDRLLDSSLNKGGMSIRPFWETRPYRTIDYPRVSSSMQKIKFADGGVYNSKSTSASNNTPAQPDPGVLAALEQSNAINLALMETIQGLNNQLAKGIRSTISRKQILEDQAIDQRIKNESEFK